MKIERNKHGEVRENGQLICTIPQDRSMIGILGTQGNTPMGKKCEFKNDFWMYVDGVKTKKWFQNVYSDGHSNEVRIWPPILQDIPKLEERCHRLSKAYFDNFQNDYLPAFNAMVKVKKAHAIPTHKYEGDNIPLWLYRASEYGGRMGIGFDWVDDKPKKLLNLKIGNAWYKAEHRSMDMGGRWHKFTTVLARAINDYLWKEHKPTKPDTTMKLNINGRDYWYRTSHNNYGVIIWQELIWPEDRVIKVDM